jgi:hypothetical protein
MKLNNPWNLIYWSEVAALVIFLFTEYVFLLH